MADDPPGPAKCLQVIWRARGTQQKLADVSGFAAKAYEQATELLDLMSICIDCHPLHAE